MVLPPFKSSPSLQTEGAEPSLPCSSPATPPHFGQGSPLGPATCQRCEPTDPRKATTVSSKGLWITLTSSWSRPQYSTQHLASSYLNSWENAVLTGSQQAAPNPPAPALPYLHTSDWLLQKLLVTLLVRNECTIKPHGASTRFLSKM